MRPPARLLPVLLTGFAAWAAHAQPAPVPPPAPRAWELTGNLRTAVGYRENLLLSALQSDDSAFAQAEAELFWWRLPTERFEALAFVNTTVTRYVDSTENPRESQTFAHAEARWFATPALQATGAVEGYRLDQVFDVSTTDAERATARLKVTGGLVSAAVRWQVRAHTWLELKPTLQRDRYRDGSDDHAQRIARGTLGRSWRDDRVEVTLSAQALRRVFDDRPQYAIGDRPLPGTELIFIQREGEVRGAITWDQERHWKTTTTLTFSENCDNGSGYFDYRRRAVRQDVTWSRAPWKVRLTARAGRYDYDVQIPTGAVGIHPPKRLKEDLSFQLRLERQWRKHALLFADFHHERSRSNEPLASYRGRTVATGIDWSF